jgi:phosphonate degradation associated HDIG domain protein
MMQLDLDAITALYESRGSAWYGNEAVSQLAHALQCAELAERAGAGLHLIAACFLHDLGHLLRASDAAEGHYVDDKHEDAAAAALSGLFPTAVVEPIRLHVAAKRYLSKAEPGYLARLSPASRRSLELQGGPFTVQEAERFLALPFAADAVRLRHSDEEAKVTGRRTSTLDHFVGMLRLCVR